MKNYPRYLIMEIENLKQILYKNQEGKASLKLVLNYIVQLQNDKNEMVARNALLRERPDLPVDRIPAHTELIRLQEENRKLKEKDDCVKTRIKNA